MRKYNLEIIVFVTGAVVMILELVGSRIIAPYAGTSIIVWTSLIGIILGSLSIGYSWGGKLADKKPDYRTLANILLLASILVASINLTKPLVLIFVQKAFTDIRLGTVVSSIFLFTPPSIVLGMVPTYAVKLKLKSLKTSGEMVGRLYAISTIGSIVGTFLAGFFLIGFFGSSKILILLSITLILTSYIASFGVAVHLLTIVVFIFCSYLLTSRINPFSSSVDIVEDTDSSYSRIIVGVFSRKINDRPILFLSTDRVFYIAGMQSAIYADGDYEPYANYIKFFELAANHLHSGVSKTLMIGGGANSFPKIFQNNNPDSTLDIIEIDPKLTELAKKHFYFEETEKIRVHHMDGRMFLVNTNESYDIIFMDAFNDLTTPYHLATMEMMEAVDFHLEENGLAVMNLVSAIEGDAGLVFRSQTNTLKKVFPYVLAFPVESDDKTRIQNIVLIASHNDLIENISNGSDPELEKLLGRGFKVDSFYNDAPIFTDEYVPIEYYANKMSPQLFKISRNSSI